MDPNRGYALIVRGLLVIRGSLAVRGVLIVRRPWLSGGPRYSQKTLRSQKNPDCQIVRKVRMITIKLYIVIEGPNQGFRVFGKEYDPVAIPWTQPWSSSWPRLDRCADYSWPGTWPGWTEGAGSSETPAAVLAAAVWLPLR